MLDLALLYGNLLVRGLLNTLVITALSFSLGLAMSLTLTFARFFVGGHANALVKAYVDFFRGTPLLVQILFVYFGLPSLGVRLDAITSAVLAIGLNSGAYQAELLRTAIKGIPEEQLLVARSLGLTRLQTFSHVIAPQAILNAMPGLVNELVTLLKESSLASVIGVMELTRVGEYMTAATFKALEALGLVALIYLAVSYVTFKALGTAERRLAIPGFERWAR